MARKKVDYEPKIKNWDDVDNALKQIAEAEIQLEKIEGQMQLAFAQIKEQAAKDSRPLQDFIKETGKEMKAFVTLHQDEIKGKTKKLNFGNTGFRQSKKKLVVPSGKEMAAHIIERLKKRGMRDCVITTEKINKEVLKQYPEHVILELGCKLQIDNTFWYETSREQVEDNE